MRPSRPFDINIDVQEEQIPQQYVCPLSLDIMRDPVMAADGYTYEREEIHNWLSQNNRSPMTNLEMPSKDLLPNRSLNSAIESWKNEVKQQWEKDHGECKPAATENNGIKEWLLNLEPGDRCDVMDSAPLNVLYTPRWFEGIVLLSNTEENKVLIHFHGWNSRFDEWVTKDSESLQPRFTKTRNWRSQLKFGDNVEINVDTDNGKRWIPGIVLKIDRKEESFYEEVKVYIKGINDANNCSRHWVDILDERLADCNTHIINRNFKKK